MPRKVRIRDNEYIRSYEHRLADGKMNILPCMDDITIAYLKMWIP
jgi:hypothetical protein